MLFIKCIGQISQNHSTNVMYSTMHAIAYNAPKGNKGSCDQKILKGINKWEILLRKVQRPTIGQKF